MLSQTERSERTHDEREIELNPRRRFPAAETAHYASLVVALLVLLRLGRDQWFFGDDWDFIVLRGLRGSSSYGLFDPHNEHWSTSPILLYRALFAVFGVRTYMPYLAAVISLHLLVAHIVWRLLRQVGVSPWLASAWVGTMLINGAGAENLMWGFQIGFVGALFVGLLVLFLVNRPQISRRREISAVALATVGLTWAGVAVPVVAAAGIVTWMRRGRWAAVRLLTVPAVVYLCWLKLAGSEGLHSHEVTKRGLLQVPAYVWRGLVATVEGYTFFAEGGAVILLALGFFLLSRSGWNRSAAAAAPAAAIGALFLFVTVAPGRIYLGLDQAASSRYQYLAWALLLPAIGLCLHELVKGDRTRELALVALAGAIAVHGIHSLMTDAENEAVREQALRRTVVAAAELMESGAPVFDNPPHRVYAPNLAPPTRLVYLLHTAHLGRSKDVTTGDRLIAAAALQVRLPPMSNLPVGNGATVSIRSIAHGVVTPVSSTCTRIQPDGGRPEVTLEVAGPSGVGIKSAAGGELRLLLRDPATGQVVDPTSAVTLTAGIATSVDLAVTQAEPILLLPPSGDTELCGVHTGRLRN